MKINVLQEKVELKLKNILLSKYEKKDFKNIEKVIFNFLAYELPKISKFKESAVYRAFLKQELPTFYKNYLPSLEKIDKKNRILRSEIDANLLIGMPFEAARIINKVNKEFNFKQEKILAFKKEEEEFTYEEILLILLLNPSRKFDSPLGRRVRAIFLNDRWNSVFAKNSRKTHMQASGSKRRSDGFFYVGGEKFRYPRDWKYASVGNVINCKCYLS